MLGLHVIETGMDKQLGRQVAVKNEIEGILPLCLYLVITGEIIEIQTIDVGKVQSDLNMALGMSL